MFDERSLRSHARPECSVMFGYMHHPSTHSVSPPSPRPQRGEGGRRDGEVQQRGAIESPLPPSPSSPYRGGRGGMYLGSDDIDTVAPLSRDTGNGYPDAHETSSPHHPDRARHGAHL